MEAHLPRGCTPGLGDILGAAKVHRDLAPSVAGFGMPGGEFGGTLDDAPGHLCGGGAEVAEAGFGDGAHDHMASGEAMGMQPEVARSGDVKREMVVIPCTLPHETFEALEHNDSVSGISHGPR